MKRVVTLLALASMLSGALSKYYISTETLTFMQAYATCRRYNYTMAKERSLEDSDAINSALKLAGATNHDFFIGGYHDFLGVFTPEWLWLETGEEITYDHWVDGNTRTLECMIRTSVVSGDGYWLSSSCTNSKYFICEY